MPKKIISITWACRICNDKYLDKDSAKWCENKGVAIPEFNPHDLVQFNPGLSYNSVELTGVSGLSAMIRSGQLGVVRDICIDEDESVNYHRLPKYYYVIFLTDRALRGKEMFVVSREQLRLYKSDGYYGNNCPLCLSQLKDSITSGIHNHVSNCASLVVGGPLSLKTRTCTGDRCHESFMTYSESLAFVRRLKKNIRWPVADTEKLVREEEFQY